MADKLDKLKQQRDQLNARIQRESARQQQAERKAREGRLMRWGVAMDAAVQSGEITPEWLAGVIDRQLTRETDRRRAFVGPLAGMEPAGQPSRDDDRQEVGE